MALQILYRGTNNTAFDLVPAAFSQQNFIDGTTVNSTLNIMSPQGVLGGSLAGIRGNGLVGKADKTHYPLGWFVNDAEGAPFDNAPAVASNKAVYICQMPLVKIDVYESHTQAGVLQTYAAGDVLYCSENGLATKETPGGGNDVGTVQVGVVVDVPTSTSPYLTVQSLL